jgi:trehalose 6-phosphate synthase
VTRLVVVSNRVAPVDEGQSTAGGLAVAVLAALREHGGIWFGWNGEVVTALPERPDIRPVNELTYATIPLTRRDYNEYYTGFANGTLWPLFHYRIDLADLSRTNLPGYVRVNQRFARHLRSLIKPGDTIWVHDYHLIPLARELRRLGIRQPIGFFLHTPLPALQLMLTLPCHQELMTALCEYDLVGFQTDTDLAAFRDYVLLEAGGEISDDGTVRCGGRALRASVFPIGIDAETVIDMAKTHDRSADANRFRRWLEKRQLIIGVDRLDYSKGLVERFTAFARLLEKHPEETRGVVLMQVAPPSRGDVGAYEEIRRQLETAAGHINGQFADFDWVPIRYLNKSFDRAMLTTFFRNSQIGLVTPLRDGMNLVAKEYVASQSEEDPGVLVLSRFAGAAQELQEAVIVNPHDPNEVADALIVALRMPVDERRARWRALLDRIRRNDVNAWRNAFLDALAEAARLSRAA